MNVSRLIPLVLTDVRRISAGARLHLGSESLPGEYVLQIIVKDLVKKKAGFSFRL